MEEAFTEASSIPCLIEGGEEFESDVRDAKQPYERIARNLLRHIFWGTPIQRDHRGVHYQESLRQVLHAFFHKRDRRFENAVREQLNILLRNMASWLASQENNAKNIIRYDIFLSDLMTLYPYFHPENNEVLHIPQRINQEWVEVQYHVRRIDLSPQTGLMAALIREEDRIYAYALHPHDSFRGAVLHLLFSGTAWPTGQGANLTWLHNFCRDGSVGESHDMTHLDAWFDECRGRTVDIAGQSKGGVVAMLVAARFPTNVRRVISVSPTALSHDTLNRLRKNWMKHANGNRAEIHVFAHPGDPVTWLEAGYLEGTHLWHVNTNTASQTTYLPFVPACFQSPLANHLQHFVGRQGTRILKGNVHAENRALHRLFFSDMKKSICSVIYPLQYIGVCADLIASHIESQDDNRYRVVRQSIRMGMTVLHYTAGGILLVSAGMIGAMYSVTRMGFRLCGNLVYDYLNVFPVSHSPFSFLRSSRGEEREQDKRGIFKIPKNPR